MGHVKEAHGIRGEVFAHIPSGEWSWARPGSTITLKPREALAKNSTVPPAKDRDLFTVTISQFRPHKAGLILKFKEVPDRNRAEELRGYVLMIPAEEFVSESGDEIYLNEVLGFTVREVLKEGAPPKEDLGTIVEFMSTGAHEILVVKDLKDPEKEHLIPFVEAFVPDIDFENKVVLVDLPEGLLE